jgi:hypothetical protein
MAFGLDIDRRHLLAVGLDGTLASYPETVKVALIHLDTSAQSERAVDAIRATPADTQEDMADMAADETMTRRALELLGSIRNDAYEAARRHCGRILRPGGRIRLPAILMNLGRMSN